MKKIKGIVDKQNDFLMRILSWGKQARKRKSQIHTMERCKKITKK